MLSGQAKKDYQREYMRRYRNSKSVRPVRPKPLDLVRPSIGPKMTYKTPDSYDLNEAVRPELDADGNTIYDY